MGENKKKKQSNEYGKKILAINVIKNNELYNLFYSKEHENGLYSLVGLSMSMFIHRTSAIWKYNVEEDTQKNDGRTQHERNENNGVSKKRTEKEKRENNNQNGKKDKTISYSTL